MKNYAKLGSKPGRPAYRTPSRLIYKKSLERPRPVYRPWHLAARLDRKSGKGKK